MTREIQLTREKVALVDDEDYEELSKYRWYCHHNYAERSVGSRPNQIAVSMHRQIMNPPDNMEIDHINRNSLDNRRSNLRVATHKQNSQNLSTWRSKITTSYKGVTRHGNKWMARIRAGDKSVFLGDFSTDVDAALAYDAAAIKYYGDFAAINGVGRE